MYNNLVKKLKDNKYKVKISTDAGNYLCNNIYYNGMKYIHDKNLNIPFLFIHIPYLKNFKNIYEFQDIINEYLAEFNDN